MRRGGEILSRPTAILRRAYRGERRGIRAIRVPSVPTGVVERPGKIADARRPILAGRAALLQLAHLCRMLACQHGSIDLQLFHGGEQSPVVCRGCQFWFLPAWHLE